MMPPFKLVLADPPWTYRDKCGAGKRGSVHKHGELSLRELCDLPVPAVCSRQCALALWVVNPLLPEGLRLMEAWGFTFKTVLLHWRKITSTGKPAWGMGHWTRSNLELCLLGVRGKPERMDAGVHAELVWPRGKPSEKPIMAYGKLEALFGDLPRLELFSRYQMPGWTALGNEIDGRDIRETLPALALEVEAYREDMARSLGVGKWPMDPLARRTRKGRTA